MMQVDGLVYIGKYIIDINRYMIYILLYISIIVWLIIMMLVDGIYWEGGCQMAVNYSPTIQQTVTRT